MVRFLDRWSGNLIVTFLDVGQGDSISVRLPSGKMVLVDAPRGFGKRNTGSVVLAELQREGYLSLDSVIVTHSDTDHSGGLEQVLGALPTAKFLFNKRFEASPIVVALSGAVRGRGGKPVPVSKRMYWDDGPARVEVIPLGGWCRERCKENDQSLVTRIRFAGCTVLLTGDIEHGSEREWVELHPGRVDVLKVPHHGSKTSSSMEFLRAIDPVLAIASVGWRNSYHHPHPSIITRYANLGIRFLRTDTEGFVRVTISPDGQVKCRSWHGNCGVYRCSGISSNIRLSELSRSRSSAARSN